MILSRENNGIWTGCNLKMNENYGLFLGEFGQLDIESKNGFDCEETRTHSVKGRKYFDLCFGLENSYREICRIVEQGLELCSLRLTSSAEIFRKRESAYVMTVRIRANVSLKK